MYFEWWVQCSGRASRIRDALTKSDIDNGTIRHETMRLDFFGWHAVLINVSLTADGQSVGRAYKKYLMPGRFTNNHAFQKPTVSIWNFSHF
jgi:hypothetical protein